MLEFIMDFIFELILEGTVLAISEKKAPMLLRIIAFIIVIVFYFGMAGLFILIGYDAMIADDMFPAILSFLIGLFIIIGGFYQIRKELKKRNEE